MPIVSDPRSASPLRVIAGLGNPGDQYVSTRHNLGFEFLNRLDAGVVWKERFGAAISEVTLKSSKVFLIKPLQFMNRSGGPIREFLDFYKISPEELLVVHDDIEILLGSIRLKVGGGDGGHNGIKSIASSLGTKDFVRLRLGIGRPPSEDHEDAVSAWVLSRYRGEEALEVDRMLTKGVSAVEELITNGLVSAQNRFH